MDSSTPPISSTSETPPPSRTISIDGGYVEGRGWHSSSQFNPRYVEYIENLLVVAHEKMDADNATLAQGQHCRWCKGPWGYDENGIRHDSDCILIRIRQVVKVD